jgi:hypothetical protein
MTTGQALLGAAAPAASALATIFFGLALLREYRSVFRSDPPRTIDTVLGLTPGRRDPCVYRGLPPGIAGRVDGRIRGHRQATRDLFALRARLLQVADFFPTPHGYG